MPPVFARAPALAIDGLLDYTKPEHIKIYRSGIKQVSENQYDCEAEGLYQFLKDVQDRAEEMGWSEGILKVTFNGGEEDERQDSFMDNYGTITLEQVTESELQYIDEGGRLAQDTYMLYKCLMASLTNEARKKVSLWSNQFRIGDENEVSGVALLKVIIRESHLDTNATTNQIRTKLSSLDSYITTIDSDIGRFNQYVKLLVQSLTARNQTSSDLLINLFKGYGAVSDETFRAWLLRKQDDQEDGTTALTPDELMQAAKNKFDTMVEKGTWNAPTSEEKFVALKAELKTTNKTLSKVQKVAAELSKKRGKKSSAKGEFKKKKFQKNDSKTSDHPKTWPAPTGANDKKQAMFKGNMWFWCGKDTGGKCECWRAHNPKECKGVAANTGGKRKPDEGVDDKKKSHFAKKLKVARAYLAKIESQATESESDDDTDE
jgi:hypothetical protein